MPWREVILLGEDRAHIDVLRGLATALDAASVARGL